MGWCESHPTFFSHPIDIDPEFADICFVMFNTNPIPNLVKESIRTLECNQYKYVIGSSVEKYLGENDKKYVLEMIGKALKAYLYDHDFALNYLDGTQRKQYGSYFEKEILVPMLNDIDFTFSEFFTLSEGEVRWKLSSSDTRKIIDESFMKHSEIPADIKREYHDYMMELN